MRRRAFTLIELLVVIGIITILAALLFPVFALARDKARQAQCLSNNRQIGSAFTLYTQDYDERLPSFSNPSLTPLGTSGWGWGMIIPTLAPYTKNTGIWSCPSAAQGTGAVQVGPAGSKVWISEGYNEYLYNYPHQLPPTYSANWSSLAALSATNAGVAGIALVADSAAGSGGQPGVFNDWAERDGLCSSDPPKNLGMLRLKYNNGWTGSCPISPYGRRHANGCIVVFCDGHARYVSGEKMVGSYGGGSTADGPPVPEYPVVNPLNTPAF